MRCFTRIDRISAYEHRVRAPDLIALLLLGDALGVSAGDLTEGLVAPLRRTGTALVTRQPGLRTEAAAISLGCHSGTQARSPATSDPQGQSHRSSRLNRRPWVVPIRCREAPASNTRVNCARARIADGEPVTVKVGYFDLLVAAGLKDALGRGHRVRILASDLKQCRRSNGVRAMRKFERSTTRMSEGMGRSMTSSKHSRGRLASRRDHEPMASSVITALLIAHVDELRRPRALSLLDDLPLPVEPRPSYARTPAQAGTDT